jgi:uncharacterized membrane protein
MVPAVISMAAFTFGWIAVVLTGRMPPFLFDISKGALGWYANYE